MNSTFRCLILNTDYPAFLRQLYSRHPGLERRPYDEQMRVRNESLFGVADFYSANLRRLGHEAWDVHVNNPHLQLAWMRAHNCPPLRRRFPWGVSLGGRFPWLTHTPLPPDWAHEVLLRQIDHYRPDVVLNQVMDEVLPDFLRRVRPKIKLLVGQVASALTPGRDWRLYDLVVSSLPNLVGFFRQRGIRGELNRLGFDPSVLAQLGSPPRTVPVSFVGSLTSDHVARVRLLESLCARTPIRVWGNGVERLPPNSPIRARHVGTVWGTDMYRLLLASKITVNYHIDLAGGHANNMRLYEATGSGALLITDWKEDLGEMFEPGKEVVTYRSPEECAEKINYYLAHDDERQAISLAGQQRALRDHNYARRMEELAEIIQRHLRLAERRGRAAHAVPLNLPCAG